MKKPVTCEIFGSLTREYPDDFFPRCAFVQLVDGYQDPGEHASFLLRLPAHFYHKTNPQAKEK